MAKTGLFMTWLNYSLGLPPAPTTGKSSGRLSKFGGFLRVLRFSTKLQRRRLRVLWALCVYIEFKIKLKYHHPGPRQANLVLIAYASSEGSGEPAHPRSLARTSAARSYKQWVKRNLQTESQIPSPFEWLGMRSYNLSWRNARRHKFAWRGSFCEVDIIQFFFFYLWDSVCSRCRV